MARVLGSPKATFFKIRPLRINLIALARMILWKTDAPMARDQESPKAKFLKIRPFRIIWGTRENDFIQNRASKMLKC